jgi:hypothetical protein
MQTYLSDKMHLKKVIPEKPIFKGLCHFFRQEICFSGITFFSGIFTFLRTKSDFLIGRTKNIEKRLL